MSVNSVILQRTQGSPLFFPPFRRPLRVTLCLLPYHRHADTLSLQNDVVLKIKRMTQVV